MHDYKFFELADMQAIEVEFIVTADQAEKLLTLVQNTGIRVFYARIPARFGVLGPKRAADPA